MELNRRIGPPLAIQLVVDGLKLTPANPTLLQAGDGIISAPVNKARGATLEWERPAQRGVSGLASLCPLRHGAPGDFWTVDRVFRDHGRLHRAPPTGPGRTFDGTRSVQDLVTSPWGVGVWKLAGASMTAPMLPPRDPLRGWPLNSADNSFGPVGDFDGGRTRQNSRLEPMGRRHLEIHPIFVHCADDGAQRNPVRRVAPQHSRQQSRHRRLMESYPDPPMP